MGWWRDFLEGRRLRPTTVAPADEPAPVHVSTSIRVWLQAALGEGDESAALERLRSDGEEVQAEIARLYASAPESETLLRWALVYGAGEVGDPNALVFFESILGAQVPPERSGDVHHFSSVAEEVTIRLQAVRGLGILAAGGNEAAVGVLNEQLRHPLYAVRVAASQALRELPGSPVSEAEIRERLPTDEAEQISALRRLPVTELQTPVEARERPHAPRPPGGVSGRALTPAETRRAPRVAERRSG